jgi:hypothetical protein
VNPSIALAAALAAAGVSLNASAQTPLLPVGCTSRDTTPASPKETSVCASFAAAPFSAEAEPDVYRAFRTSPGAAGVQLDAERCRLFTVDGSGRKHELNCGEVKALIAAAEKDSKETKADGPEDPNDEKHLKQAGDAAAGAASSGAAGTDADSKRAFDGFSATKGLADSMTTADEKGLSRLPPEARLSGVLNADIRKKYDEGYTGQKDHAGHNLLMNFTDAQGRAHLPNIVLVDYANASATYNYETKSIWLNQNIARDDLVSAVPEAQRDELAARLSNADGEVNVAKLARYLIDSPSARAALLDQEIGTIFHETYHAYQEKRDRKSGLDDILSNIADPASKSIGKDPLEREREAIYQEMTFFHQRMMRDPSLAGRASPTDIQMYTALLRGYPQFKSYVDDTYRNDYAGMNFQDLPTIAATLADRKRSVVQAAASDYEQRANTFATQLLPSMMIQGYPTVIPRLTAAGRSTEALTLVDDAPDDVRARFGKTAFADMEKFLTSKVPAPLFDRVNAWNPYIVYLKKNHVDMPKIVRASYIRDYHEAAEFYMTRASSLPAADPDCPADPSCRAPDHARKYGEWRSNDFVEELSMADSFAGNLPDNDPDKKVLISRINAMGRAAGAAVSAAGVVVSR